MTSVVPFVIYVGIFVGSYLVVSRIVRHVTRTDFTALKTVTFGDESAVVSDRVASVISVLTLFLLWGMFTGSALVPSFLHAPGPYLGDGRFDYVVESADGAPPSADGAPLFLLGLDLTPPPRRGVTGIWGPLARRQLLDPGRLGALALQSGDPPLRRRYQGFLEALRRTPTGGRPR